MTLSQMNLDLWPIFRDHVWPESRFGVCRLVLAARLQYFCGFKRSNMRYDVGPRHYGGSQGHLKVRSDH